MDPVEALERIASRLERRREPGYRVQAFRRAARSIRDVPRAELQRLADAGRLQDLPGIGGTTASVIAEALGGEVPSYLQKLESLPLEEPSGVGAPLQRALRGDLHLHSDWSDGGAPIEAMATTARELGHEYLALTDHSPRLTVANGLSPERLARQLEVVAALNERFADEAASGAAPAFRLLTGVETDINEDGTLDQEPELLAAVDVVVASVHSKLRMPADEMTDRMVRAMADPNADILGHCTGRLVTGRGRPESQFDADLVFFACQRFGKAVEVNCRPERLDPPRRLLARLVEMDVHLAVNTDAHATDQLFWHPYGCDRAVEAGVDPARVVNTWPADDLLAWTASHAP